MKLFSINEDDLKTLEECLPKLTLRIGPDTTNADRVMIRRVQQVMQNVRWDYQPHSEIEHIPDTEQDDGAA